MKKTASPIASFRSEIKQIDRQTDKIYRLSISRWNKHLKKTTASRNS
jgi:hypothetical protein